ATLTPRSRTNFTASSLYSRLNFLRCIPSLQFHGKHLNSVSTKPAAAHHTAMPDEGGIHAISSK
ncbi:MAG: hypothetical protein K0M60_20790, partial [Hydrogenophaga sp.]|nr:hypothetical protein [Hydrogenophaga sp.]